MPEDIWVENLDAALDALEGSPTSSDVMYVTDDYAASTGVAVAVRRAMEGGGGGSLPAGFDVDANATLTQTPVDQTGDSPFINLIYKPEELIDESNEGLVMSVRPEGADPGGEDNLFRLGVNVFKYRSAAGESNANFSVAPQDHPSTQANLAASTDATLLLQGDSGTARVSSDGLVVIPNLPTANPLNAGQLWNDGGTLKVSAG